MHSLRPWLVTALALPLFPAPSGSGIRVEEGLVTIDARAAPLSDIVDQLGHQTGMRVVYESGRPRQIVTASIEGLTPPAALAKLFEGLGVDYCFSLDVTGSRVEALIISGATGAPRVPSPIARSVTAGEPSLDASPAGDEETFEPPSPSAAAVAADDPSVGSSAPAGEPNFRAPIGETDVPAAVDPTNVSTPVEEARPPYAVGTIPSPVFPVGASMPMLPVIPRPVFPIGASSPQPPQ